MCVELKMTHFSKTDAKYRNLFFIRIFPEFMIFIIPGPGIREQSLV